MTLARLATAIAVLFMTAGPAHAKVARYALIVGANHGHAWEVPLSFAEEDARRMARLLSELGGFDPENVSLLIGAEAGDVGATALVADRLHRRRDDADKDRACLEDRRSGEEKRRVGLTHPHEEAVDVHACGVDRNAAQPEAPLPDEGAKRRIELVEDPEVSGRSRDGHRDDARGRVGGRERHRQREQGRPVERTGRIDIEQKSAG